MAEQDPYRPVQPQPESAATAAEIQARALDDLGQSLASAVQALLRSGRTAEADVLMGHRQPGLVPHWLTTSREWSVLMNPPASIDILQLSEDAPKASGTTATDFYIKSDVSPSDIVEWIGHQEK